MKTEKVLLDELIESGRLPEPTEEAFRSMLDGLENGRRCLSRDQREWVLDMHSKLELDTGIENLVSSGQMKVTEAEKKGVADMLASLGPKPLAPPGRRKPKE